MRKTKKIIRLIILLAVASAVIIGIAEMNDNRDSDNINLYFFNRDKSTITALEKEITSKDENELYTNIADALIKGPSDKKHTAIMDKSVTVKNITKSGNSLAIDFSENYKDSDLLTTYAVVKTYTQLDGITSVKVSADGVDILPDGYIRGDDINLESDYDSATGITLYFADTGKTKLVKEYRKININDTRPVEQYIITELLKGPENKDNAKLLSSDTGVLSVETTDGTCYVNFKQDFINKNTSSQNTENLIIYSIVNSLTERDNIENVQFLIEGKKTDKFGGINISELFYRNTDI